MFVGPHHLTFDEISNWRRRRRRVGDFSDQIGCWRFGNSVYENPKIGNLKENVEAHTKPEKQTLTITKPTTFLLFIEPYPTEVWLELSSLAGYRHLKNQPRILTNSLIKLLDEK